MNDLWSGSSQKLKNYFDILSTELEKETVKKVFFLYYFYLLLQEILPSVSPVVALNFSSNM
jgi:hypothetical protein